MNQMMSFCLSSLVAIYVCVLPPLDTYLHHTPHAASHTVDSGLASIVHADDRADVRYALNAAKLMPVGVVRYRVVACM